MSSNGHRDSIPSSDEDSSPTPPEMRWAERVQRAGALPPYAREPEAATAVMLYELETIETRLDRMAHQVGELRTAVDALEEHTLRAIATEEDHRRSLRRMLSDQAECVHDESRKGALRGSGTVAGLVAVVYALAESGILARVVRELLGG